jgi:hypothetical protein
MFGLPGKSGRIAVLGGFVNPDDLRPGPPMQPYHCRIVLPTASLSAQEDLHVNTVHEYPARSNGARAGIIIAIVAVLAIIAAFAFGLIDIDQTKETKVPEVSVQGGQAPAFDVDTAKVDVGTKNADIKVPTVDVDVGSTNADIKVPTVDVDKAK